MNFIEMGCIGTDGSVDGLGWAGAGGWGMAGYV